MEKVENSQKSRCWIGRTIPSIFQRNVCHPMKSKTDEQILVTYTYMYGKSQLNVCKYTVQYTDPMG